MRKKYHDKKKEKQKNNHFGPLENLVISDYIEFNFYKKISIIIPTFGNPIMLSECLNSIQTNNDYEIIVGIDGCQETLDYVKNNKFNQNIIFYYFEKNVGPYVVKNSLSNIASSDIILFFDSDDIMKENMIPEILEKMKTNEFVKPMYSDFTNTPNYNITKSNKYGEGVFAIKKELFLSMNGFEPWPVAADSDFKGRLYKNNIKFQYTNNVVFHRRVHPNSLTQKKETGLASSLRGKYYSISKNKTNFGPLPQLVTSDFYEVFTEKEYNTNNDIEPTIEIPKPKDLSPILKNQKTIDYDRINDILGKKNTEPPKQQPKPRITNPPINRNEINEMRAKLAKESIKRK
jgi:glycosyltransferase involved in cell wall biosynthesis